MMPGMDGFEVCQRMKSNPATQDIPIIFMTALAERANRIRGLEMGAVDYMIKPFEPAELLARVRTQLTLRATSRALSEKIMQLERAQEELSEAKARIERELLTRQRAEAERAELQARIIAEKEARLLELSAPVIPISEGVLVMPLIGHMDEARAERILDAALARTAETGAKAMILDITGASLSDEKVARALLKTAGALRLLGARTVLTGIRPEVARTLLSFGIELSGITTRSTLHGGIQCVMGPTRAA